MTTYQTLWTMSSDAVTRLTNQNQFGAFSVHVDGSDNSVIFVTKKPSTSISIDLQDKYGLFASSDTTLNVYSDEGVHVSCDAVLKKKYIWNGFSLELDKTSGDLSTPSIQITNNTGKDAAFGLTKFDTKSNTYLPICVDVSYASRPKSKPTVTFIYTPTSTIYARILSDSNPTKDPKLPPTMTTGSVIPDIGRWTKFKISKSNTQFNLDLTPKRWMSSASTIVATFPAAAPTSSPSPPTDVTPTPAPTLPPPPPLQAAPANPNVTYPCECSRKDADEREADEDESTEIESLAVSEVSMPDCLCNYSVAEAEDDEESQSHSSQSDASSVGDIFVRYSNAFKGSELQDAVFVKYNLMKEEEEAEAEEEAEEGESNGDHSDCEDDNCDEKSVGNLFVRYNRSLVSETRGSVYEEGEERADKEEDEDTSCSETANEAIVNWSAPVHHCSDSDDERAREAPQEKRSCRASARPARSMWRLRAVDEARVAQSESDSASENDEGNEEQEEKEEKAESKEEEGNQRVVFAPEKREYAESQPLGDVFTRLAQTLALDPVDEPIPRAATDDEEVKDEQLGEDTHEEVEEEKDDAEAKSVDSYPEENEKWNDSFGGFGDYM